jgi:hypothetical protein
MLNIQNLLQEVKQMYQRAVYSCDESQWDNPDEYVALFLQGRIAIGLEHDEFDIKNKKILEQIVFGLGSYIEMRSGCYCKKDKEFKRLEKEYKKAMKLLADHYEEIWKYK